MRFHSPQLLINAAIIAALVPGLWFWLEKNAGQRFARFASPLLMSLILRGGSFAELKAKRVTRMVLLTLSMFFAVVALARPQLGMREETIQSEGLDIVFMLDVSNSMLTEDIVPNRMKKAKHIIKNFLDRLSGDRAGIVAFAGSAYSAVPLTTDYDFARQTLDVLDETSVSNQGSDLAKALTVSMQLLVRGGVIDDEDPTAGQADSSSRVLVVVSDGESHEGEEAKLIPQLKEAGIRVFTIGVGSIKGGPIPLRDETGQLRGYKKEMNGNMILSKLETANLEAIASKTSGKFYAASTNEGEVEEILNELSSLDRATGGARRVIVYDEVFQYPLALSVLLLVIMLFLRETGAAAVVAAQPQVEKTGKKPAARPAELLGMAFVLWAVLSAFAERPALAAKSVGEYQSTKKGVEAYEDKDYTGAVQHFGKAQAADPDSSVHHLNLGDALLKSGSPEGAIPEFEAVTKSKSPTEAAKGSFNLGKAYEAQKNFEQAIRSYQSGLDQLALDPKSDPEAELRIKRALEQAQQQKQQQQDQAQQGKGGSGGGAGQPKEDQKDDKDDKKEKENKQYQIPRKKQEFKAEKMTGNDANRIIKQLQEQEKKAQQHVMRSKTGKPKDDKTITKDW